MIRIIVALIAFAVTASGADAACSPGRFEDDLLRAWPRAQTVRAPRTPLSASEALCVQNTLVDWLRGSQGDPVGWKLGLTSAAARRQFGVERPVAGRLLERMLRPEGASFSPDYAGRPIIEADMLVIVKDEWINDARTPMEVALHLLTLRPFIEVADLVLAEGEKLTAETIIAINVGARYGVYGREIAVEPTHAFVDALARMTVTLTEGIRTEVARAPGSAILDHPFNAVIELAAQLYERGDRLSAGDVISLGSFGAPAVPRRGQNYTARYEGLPGGPLSVAVAFR